MTDSTPTPVARRRPRYILGTFWLFVTVGLFTSGVSGGGIGVVLISLLTLLYTIYLYRGGRWGLIVW